MGLLFENGSGWHLGFRAMLKLSEEGEIRGRISETKLGCSFIVQITSLTSAGLESGDALCFCDLVAGGNGQNHYAGTSDR